VFALNELRLFDRLLVPVFIMDKRGDIEFFNTSAQNLASAINPNTEQMNIKDLVPPHDLLHLIGIEPYFAKLPSSFRLLVQVKADRIVPVLFAAQAYDLEDRVLLIGQSQEDIMSLASENARELSQAADHVSNLEVRVFKQTAKLAAESTRRAQAEKSTRLESEQKVRLIGSTLHHLNNPLNQLRGANSSLTSNLKTISNSINQLFSDASEDPEASELRNHYRQMFDHAQDNTQIIENALARIENTSEVLKVVSKVYGSIAQSTTISEIYQLSAQRLNSRLKIDLSNLDLDSDTYEIGGHPTLYAYAIDLIDTAMTDQSLNYESVKFTVSKDHCEVVWLNLRQNSFSESCSDSPISSEEALAHVSEEINYLLGHYQACLIPHESNLHLQLPRIDGKWWKRVREDETAGIKGH